MVAHLIDLSVYLKSKYNCFLINDNSIQQIRSTKMGKHENAIYPNVTCGFFQVLRQYF